MLLCIVQLLASILEIVSFHKTRSYSPGLELSNLQTHRSPLSHHDSPKSLLPTRTKDLQGSNSIKSRNTPYVPRVRRGYVTKIVFRVKFSSSREAW